MSLTRTLLRRTRPPSVASARGLLLGWFLTPGFGASPSWGGLRHGRRGFRLP